MQESIDGVRVNALRINFDKTEVTVHGRSPSQIDSVIVQNKVVSKAETSKFLGILVDSKLDGKEHIRELCKKLSKATAALSFLRRHIGTARMKQLYNAYFNSHLIYGIEFWGLAGKSALKEVHRLQNRALRLCSSDYSCSRERYRELEILKLPSLVSFRLLLLVYKQIHDLQPKVLPIQLLSSVSQIPTRSSETLLIEVVRTHTAMSRSAARTGSRLWNSLPLHIRQKPTLSQFKKALKAVLLEEQVLRNSSFSVY